MRRPKNATARDARGGLWMRLRRRLAQEDGFGLLELLMTIVILSTAIAGLLTIFMGSAFALARAGHQGTATVIIDRTFEYYRRAPWWDIRLVKHGPGNSGGVVDTDVTGDAVYPTQCSGCPSGASSSLVDEDAGSNDTYGSGSVNNTAACNDGTLSPDPDVDSTAPITNCLAIKNVTGADGDPYRVYTYMKYGCNTEEWSSTHSYALNDYVYIHATGVWYQSIHAANLANAPATSPTFWSTTVPSPCPPDYSTKVITILVRQLKPDGTLLNGSTTGILAKETINFSYQSYTSAYCGTCS